MQHNKRRDAIHELALRAGLDPVSDGRMNGRVTLTARAPNGAERFFSIGGNPKTDPKKDVTEFERMKRFARDNGKAPATPAAAPTARVAVAPPPTTTPEPIAAPAPPPAALIQQTTLTLVHPESPKPVTTAKSAANAPKVEIRQNKLTFQKSLALHNHLLATDVTQFESIEALTDAATSALQFTLTTANMVTGLKEAGITYFVKKPRPALVGEEVATRALALAEANAKLLEHQSLIQKRFAEVLGQHIVNCGDTMPPDFGRLMRSLGLDVPTKPLIHKSTAS